jgi:formate hydrogenlyase subunit 6/NADH:ubiquinone oxidoreductase subunit I
MFTILKTRLAQGHRTTKFPLELPVLADRYRGKPTIDASKCPEDCALCADVCPTGAISTTGKMALDLGKCLFCTDCVDACPPGAIRYTQDYRLATTR